MAMLCYKNKTMTKQEILNYIFKSKDGASWNEVSEMLKIKDKQIKEQKQKIEKIFELIEEENMSPTDEHIMIDRKEWKEIKEEVTKK